MMLYLIQCEKAVDFHFVVHVNQNLIFLVWVDSQGLFVVFLLDWKKPNIFLGNFIKVREKIIVWIY